MYLSVERVQSICIKTRKLWPAWMLVMGLVLVSRFCKLSSSIQCTSDGFVPRVQRILQVVVACSDAAELS